MSRKPYAYETRSAKAVAPQFPEGTRLKVTEKEDRIILEFPTVRKENALSRALDYEVVVEARVEDYRRQVEYRRVYSSGIALAERHDRGPVRVVFDKKKFEENRYCDMVYKVCPCDAWGNKGKPICASHSKLFLPVV